MKTNSQKTFVSDDGSDWTQRHNFKMKSPIEKSVAKFGSLFNVKKWPVQRNFFSLSNVAVGIKWTFGSLGFRFLHTTGVMPFLQTRWEVCCIVDTRSTGVNKKGSDWLFITLIRPSDCLRASPNDGGKLLLAAVSGLVVDASRSVRDRLWADPPPPSAGSDKAAAMCSGSGVDSCLVWLLTPEFLRDTRPGASAASTGSGGSGRSVNGDRASNTDRIALGEVAACCCCWFLRNDRMKICSCNCLTRFRAASKSSWSCSVGLTWNSLVSWKMCCISFSRMMFIVWRRLSAKVCCWPGSTGCGLVMGGAMVGLLVAVVLEMGGLPPPTTPPPARPGLVVGSTVWAVGIFVGDLPRRVRATKALAVNAKNQMSDKMIDSLQNFHHPNSFLKS